MSKKRKWWNQSKRMFLTIELAIGLPAAALIALSIWNLHMIERDKAVEAAIHRDFSQMLKITEKKIVKQTAELIESVRRDFPSENDKFAQALDHLFIDRPFVAQLYLYDEKAGWIFRSNPAREWESGYCLESEERSKYLSTWIAQEAKEMMAILRKREEFENLTYSFYSKVTQRGNGLDYAWFVLFTLPNFSPERVALGGMYFDTQYVRQNLLPHALNGVLQTDLAEQTNSTNPVAIMAHLKKDKAVFAASEGWDGGDPEVERYTEMAFPGLALAIKFRGTTVAALSQRFLQTNLWIVACLSLLLTGGIWLTFRSVHREMKLAKLKSDFVANVSHELRTPLALIRLYAETLEMGRLSTKDKFQEYYRIIRKESERLTALINNILDFARIEAGRKEYDFRETDVGQLVRSTLDAYRYQIEQQGFRLEENIAEDLPPVPVDREAIARSLVNLVNNALKYSSDEKFLAVHLYRANGDLKLEVEDHGIGIPRHEQQRIFENFYRVGDPLVHNTKGTGMGLALVRHIVQAHGGHVSVESTPGKGSKFIITLPVNRERFAASAPQAA
jgi:signal transduction histidine kinase